MNTQAQVAPIASGGCAATAPGSEWTPRRRRQMDWRGPGSRVPPRQAETAQLSPLLYRRQSVHAARSHRLKVRRGRVAEAFDGVPDLGPSWQRRQCIGHTEDAAIAEDDLLTD